MNTYHFNAYWRLCLFGLCMAIAYDAPLWVWLAGGLCAMKITLRTNL